MRRLRFYLDVTAEDDAQADYKRCAWVLEDAIRKMSNGHCAPGMDLARATFYLANVKVLRKQPRSAGT